MRFKVLDTKQNELKVGDCVVIGRLQRFRDASWTIILLTGFQISQLRETHRPKVVYGYQVLKGLHFASTQDKRLPIDDDGVARLRNAERYARSCSACPNFLDCVLNGVQKALEHEHQQESVR